MIQRLNPRGKRKGGGWYRYRCRWNYVPPPRPLRKIVGVYTRRSAAGRVPAPAHRRVHLCLACLYPSSGGDGVRACQADDEKELVHSGYPCEVEGTRRVWTRARGWNGPGESNCESKSCEGGWEGGREEANETNREPGGEQGAGLRLRCVLVWPKGMEGRISGWSTPEGWSGGWRDPGTAGKGVDSLGAARLPKQ